MSLQSNGFQSVFLLRRQNLAKFFQIKFMSTLMGTNPRALRPRIEGRSDIEVSNITRFQTQPAEFYNKGNLRATPVALPPTFNDNCFCR